MRRRYPIVEVWWDDAAGNDGWHSRQYAKQWAKRRYKVRSSGLLISDTKRGLTLALSQNCLGGVGDLLRIPRGMVLKMRTVAKVDP